MAVKKRITRKQLLKEPDTFMTFSGKAVAFARENQKQLLYAVAGVMVLVIAFSLVWYFSGLSENKAYALLNEGLSHYGRENPGEQGGHFDEVAKERFDRLVTEYGSTTPGRLGRHLYGDVMYAAGAFEEAARAYEESLKVFGEDPILRPLIWNALAYAYEGKKDLAGAIQCWEKVTGFEGTLAKAEAYFNLGRTYEATMNAPKAREAYEKLIDSFPDALYVDVARGKLAQLGATEDGEIPG